DLHEHLDRLVGLLVEQVVEATEVLRGQPADLGAAGAGAALPRQQPAAGEGNREQQEQPGQFVHAGSVPGSSGGSAGAASRSLAATSARWRRSRRFSGTTMPKATASPPSSAPASAASSSAGP